MSLVVTEHHLHNHGMPCTLRVAEAQRAVAVHDTEGGTSDEAMWATISWMHATARQRNASYNEFWRFSEATGELRCVVVVPSAYAAHSIAPQPFNAEGLPVYAPDEQVRAALGTGWRDPNMWVYAISICGKVADVERFARDARFIAAARQRLEQLKAKGIPSDRLLEHFRFNPRTRSDPGRSVVPAIQAKEEVMPRLRRVRESWITRKDPLTPLFMDGPGQGEMKFFLPETRITSEFETADGLWRVVGIDQDGVWVPRKDKHGYAINSVPGSRSPLQGFGEPTPDESRVDAIKRRIAEFAADIADD